MKRDNGSDQEIGADYFLDITKDACPLTFVKTRLLIERMSSGATAMVRLGGGEPLENVPRSVRELGHEVLAIEAEEGAAGVFRLLLRKA